jgi:hypothetical protein
MEGQRVFDFAKSLLCRLHSAPEQPIEVSKPRETPKQLEYESAIVEGATAWDGVVLTEGMEGSTVQLVCPLLRSFLSLSYYSLLFVSFYHVSLTVLRKENRELKSRYEKLLKQLSLKDNQLLDLQSRLAEPTRPEPTRRSKVTQYSHSGISNQRVVYHPNPQPPTHNYYALHTYSTPLYCMCPMRMSCLHTHHPIHSRQCSRLLLFTILCLFVRTLVCACTVHTLCVRRCPMRTSCRRSCPPTRTCTDASKTSTFNWAR